LLKTIHSTVLLSNDASVVKAYPHSLIESLISGKPVITSKQIAMSDFVEENSCGVVLNDFDASHLLKLIDKLQANYTQYCNATFALDVNLFSNKRMLADYEKLYTRLTSN